MLHFINSFNLGTAKSANLSLLIKNDQRPLAMFSRLFAFLTHLSLNQLFCKRDDGGNPDEHGPWGRLRTKFGEDVGNDKHHNGRAKESIRNHVCIM